MVRQRGTPAHHSRLHPGKPLPNGLPDTASHADHMKADLKMLLQCNAYVRSRQRRLLHRVSGGRRLRNNVIVRALKKRE